MQDDHLLRAMSCDPKHRRVLISDARSPLALPLAKGLLAAGAAHVFVGEAEGWRRWAGRAAFEGMENVSIMALDVTDATSVERLAAEIGGKTDILINNAQFARPGGVMGGDTVFARDAMEVNALGLMRLAQGFGPGMAARTQDGTNAACAFVSVLNVQSLVADGRFSAFAASQSAARSITQSLRAEFRASGLRVMNVYTGAVEGDDWFQPLPPPKVAPKAVARAVVSGLVDGLEEVACGEVAKDILARREENVALLEREMTGGGT